MTGTVGFYHRALLIVALAFTTHAQATPISVDWARSLLFSIGGGLENPLLRVAFNPQPEPPAAGQLSFDQPLMTGYPPDPIITHSGAETGDMFRLLFGIGNTSPLSLPASVFSDEPAGHAFAFDVLFDAIGVPATAFHVVLELMSASGGAPGSWVAFNPQPEPPALGAGAQSFGADFTFSSFSDVSLRVQIFDAAGNPLQLHLVPEPSTLLLFALAGLFAYRRARVT